MLILSHQHWWVVFTSCSLRILLRSFHLIRLAKRLPLRVYLLAFLIILLLLSWRLSLSDVALRLHFYRLLSVPDLLRVYHFWLAKARLWVAICMLIDGCFLFLIRLRKWWLQRFAPFIRTALLTLPCLWPLFCHALVLLYLLCYWLLQLFIWIFQSLLWWLFHFIHLHFHLLITWSKSR